MVPFAGYEMPVHYSAGIRAEHAAVRRAAGIFDVSHMGEFTIRGEDAEALVQRVAVNDASRIQVGQAQYSALCNEKGGVLDDLLVYRFPDRFLLVVNGSNRRKDWEWIRARAARFAVDLSDDSDDVALLALQGPASPDVLSRMTSAALDDLGYYRFVEDEVAGVPATVSRTGYTGEDGFELYLPARSAAAVWKAALDVGEPFGLVPAGLGARDSLRLEMGYPLYGNDLDEEHTALESGLGWIVKLDVGDFVGRDALVAEKERGVSRRLVGVRLTERGFPRPGYPLTLEGERVGAVTSGAHSPSLGDGIALGYARVDAARLGARLDVRIRGRDVPGRVERPPFYAEGSIKR